MASEIKSGQQSALTVTRLSKGMKKKLSAHVKKNRTSEAQYLRDLIQADMEKQYPKKEKSDKPELSDTDV